MLVKMENAYLSILRVVILVSATIALIVAAVGLISAAPSMLRWAGIAQPEKASGGSLREFIEEQKITETAVAEDSDQPQPDLMSPVIRDASSTIFSYLKGTGKLTQKEWATGLQQVSSEFVLDSSDYENSVLRLAEELKSSKGKSLTESKVLNLLDWNTSRFRDDLEIKRMTEAQESSEFLVKLAAAGTGFLAFVAIIFIFLFVKIERNLRQKTLEDEFANEND